jgi:hypothetical protein
MATTTNYSWTTPNDSDPFKDGALAIRTLGSAVDSTLFTALGGAYAGLRLVKKQTIGSGVSSVNVTSAFSSTYPNYKIMVAGGASSTNTFFNIRLGAAVSGYRHQLAGGNFSGTAQLIGSASTSAWFYFGTATTAGLSLNVDVLSPQLATLTTCSGYASDIGSWSGMSTGVIPATTQFTDFSLLANAGTLTGGTIYVYGYGAS